jgi:DNA-directed RNA polymerase specialized sigma24 family protein
VAAALAASLDDHPTELRLTMERALESTTSLLQQVAAGDDQARERLCQHFLPILSRWAHGRLPDYARDLSETQDLVQAALIRALDHVEDFESLREGAFLAYLRKILLNNIRMEIRRVTAPQSAWFLGF